jgi:hypothetical protein
MDLRCVAAFTGVILLALTGAAAAQGTFGNLPTFETAPPAPPPGTGGPPPGARPAPQAPPPGAGPPPAAGPPPGAGATGPPPGAQQDPCFRDFMPLREEAQKRGSLIQAAQSRGPTREEMCQLFKNFTAAEAKVIKFVTEKQSACGIPNEVVTKMKADQGQHAKVRDKICSGGPAAGKAPAPAVPKLSDELGVGRIADPTTSSSGRGTFDTLTGNPFQR